MQPFNAVWKSVRTHLIKPAEDGLWRPIRERLMPSETDSLRDERARVRIQAEKAAPIVWLVGKTGAGKTSIVQELTGSDRAKIGNGYSPCTRTAAMFDFPEEAPLIRFLDTRGLDEPGYDPAEDIAICAGASHLIIATVRATDPNQQSVLAVVQAARKQRPDWPVVVAQTTLHAAYPPGTDHVVPYPFDRADAALPGDLRRVLASQRDQFAKLPGNGPVCFVAIDFTPPEDGFTPSNYGAAAFEDAIVAIAPDALAASIASIRSGENDAISASSRSLVVAYAVAAMAPAAVPVPFVDAAGIAAVAAVMLRTLARRYDIDWTVRSFGEFTASLGTGVLVSQLVKYGGSELAKLVPFAGLALSVAAAFAFIYALGTAACVYLSHRRRGSAEPDAAVRAAFAEALRSGFKQAARFRSGRQTRGGAV